MKMGISDVLVIIMAVAFGIISFNKCLKLETKILELENEILMLKLNKYEILNKKLEYINRELGIHDIPIDFKNKKQNK